MRANWDRPEYLVLYERSFKQTIAYPMVLDPGRIDEKLVDQLMARPYWGLDRSHTTLMPVARERLLRVTSAGAYKRCSCT